MAYKVVKDVDKFSDKTTLTMNKEFALSNGTTIFTHRATIGIRHLSMPDVDTILLDYSYSEVDGDCLYLDGGNLILRINNRENISLPFLTQVKGARLNMKIITEGSIQEVVNIIMLR